MLKQTMNAIADGCDRWEDGDDSIITTYDIVPDLNAVRIYAHTTLPLDQFRKIVPRLLEQTRALLRPEEKAVKSILIDFDECFPIPGQKIGDVIHVKKPAAR